MTFSIIKSITLICCMLISAITFSQTKEVNQTCSADTDCKSDICLKLKSGSVCGTCSQTTYNSMRSKVLSACKGLESGWKPGTSAEFIGRRASDNRVSSEAFTLIINRAKKCKAVRQNLTKTCFKNGEKYDKFDHKGQIEQIDDSVKETETLRATMSRKNEVYYCSKNTYESRLSTFKSKCDRLDFSRIESDLEKMLNEMEDEEKVDCGDIKEYMDDCDDCLEAAKSLMKDGFKSSVTHFPIKYKLKMESAEKLYKESDALFDMANSDRLCE